ncbi:outer membrane protein [Asticcacaulis sp. YBE204]|uniref:outer membrane protein n=1 Tax=Asticcacaulis sp. YBE204 TaxID=1282363 RepID=UPI0003C3CDD2|nr:outer membrane beta-barrel protein [Asticcacaulis sp. YBE204]ESQ79766.1 hypothetical protein AEYBE204_07940 [Asticcacaulis sp. YBE204]
MIRFAITGLLAASAVLGASGATAQTWSGPYMGVAIGDTKVKESDETVVFDTNLDGNYGDTVNTTANVNAFSPGFCDGKYVGTAPAAGCTEDGSEENLSVRLGYDWQMGSFVFGLVGEVSAIDASDSVSAFSTTPAGYSFTREIRSLNSVRARAGYDLGTWLPYVTAGYAQADLHRTFSTTNGLNSFTATNGDDGKGYQVGLGIEKRFGDHWSVGLEYLHTSLDDDGITVRAGPGNALPTNPFIIVNKSGTDMRRTEDTFKLDSVMLTVNFRFGAM